MPTYKALGVTATLSVADLRGTLSDVIELRQGATQSADYKRIERVFDNGERLKERPIGADGSEKGVLQFIGKHEDMALFMAEASDRPSARPSFNNPIAAANTLEGPKATGMPVQLTASDSMTSLDSPLTSLAATPMVGTPLAKRGNSIMQNDMSIQNMFPSFAATQEYPSEPSATRALMLTVETNLKSHVSKIEKKKGDRPVPDMKIEVFFNGELVDTAFINPRRQAVQLSNNNKSLFRGTRFHRQIEKPWVYQGDASSRNRRTATERWSAVASNLVQEAHSRGTNKHGASPPSAEYLTALSAISLPDRLADKNNFGILDIVMTTGVGRKYGPEAGYLSQPDRMVSAIFKANQAVPAVLEDPVIDTPALEPPSTSPEIPLAKRTRSMQVIDEVVDLSLSPRQRGTRSKTEACANELGLTPSKKKIIQNYENGRKQPGKARTLNQRLGDILEMVPQDRDAAIQYLMSLLQEEDKLLSSTTPDVPQSPPRKKVKSGDEVSNPFAALAQTRTDTAIDFGASPNGHLIQRITTMSPHQTPTKKTQAASLVASPMKSISKECSSIGLRKGRTSQQWLSGDAADAFVVPALCEGSSLTYAEASMQRQLAKARPGEFNEEQLVVGMRFVVV